MGKVTQISESKKAQTNLKKKMPPADQIIGALVSPGDNLYLLGNVKERIQHESELKILASICEAAHTEMANRIREASAKLGVEVVLKTFAFIP